ncbi:retinol dehydrogenase 8 [Ramaria rubella]|nr:retinol dehydrogenase 8 [Ramaria rubella]
MARVWLITGCATGLGKEICLSALARGDKVIATCRGDPQTRLAGLIAKGADTLSLDVTAPMEEIHAFAKTATAIHGRVDIICNNAGYVQPGALEEFSPEETLKQFETLVFGPLNIARAFLPQMRERKAACGPYLASKSALSALTRTLAAEVSPFNIQATCIEIGEFRTDVFFEIAWAAVRIPAYDKISAPTRQLLGPHYKQRGDPHKGAERIVDLLTGTGLAKGKKLPACIMLGDDAYTVWKPARAASQEEEKEWREWSSGTDLDNIDTPSVFHVI